MPRAGGICGPRRASETATSGGLPDDKQICPQRVGVGPAPGIIFGGAVFVSRSNDVRQLGTVEGDGVERRVEAGIPRAMSSGFWCR
jgi:hypothetical protein